MPHTHTEKAFNLKVAFRGARFVRTLETSKIYTALRIVTAMFNMVCVGGGQSSRR